MSARRWERCYWNPKEVARKHGVSENAVKRWFDQGLLTGFRLPGGRPTIADSSLRRFERQEWPAISQARTKRAEREAAARARSEDIIQWVVACGPTIPGDLDPEGHYVYIAWTLEDDEALYIGVTSRLYNRMRDHETESFRWWPFADHFDLLGYDSRASAEAGELWWIRQLDPHFNLAVRDPHNETDCRWCRRILLEVAQ